MARVELAGITKGYQPERPALDGIDLALADGELLTVVGPSGSGKTTLIRIVAGLEVADSGRVCLDDQPVDGWPPAAPTWRWSFNTPRCCPT